MISYRKFFQDHESVLRSFEKIAFFFLEIKRLYLVQKIYLFKIFSSLRIRALFLDSIKETETYYLRGTLISIKKTRNVNTWLDIHWLNLTWHDCTWFDIMWLDMTWLKHYYCLMCFHLRSKRSILVTFSIYLENPLTHYIFLPHTLALG